MRWLVELVGGAVLAVLALLWLGVWVRILSQKTEHSVDRIRKALGSAHASGEELRVPVKSYYPLSREMIKDLGKAHGWRSIGAGASSSGVDKVRLLPDRNVKERADE